MRVSGGGVMSGSPMDPDDAARVWAQNSADNDSRRWLAVKLRDAGRGVYGAACVLTDLGPRGGNATRSDREDAIRVLLAEMSKTHTELARERRLGIEAAERVAMACDLLGDEHGDIVLLAEVKTAEAQRYRSRCPVTAEDVRDAGVTRTKALAWRDRQEHASHPLAGRKLLAKYINEHAAAYGEPAFDILDEMAKEPAR